MEYDLRIGPRGIRLSVGLLLSMTDRIMQLNIFLNIKKDKKILQVAQIVKKKEKKKL